MPQVPKLDISTISAAGPSGSFFNISGATPEAFGAGVGAAEQRLGAQVEHAGDVLQKHANLLQDRANEAAANDMFVQWDIEAAKVGVWYRSLQGKQAVDAHPEYIKKLEETRNTFLSSAPNGEAARLFDRDSKRRMGYMITDSAYYAGNQNKAYNTNAARARQTLGVQNAGNSKDDNEFQFNVDSALKGLDADAIENGWSPEVKEVQKEKIISSAWQNRIATIAMSDPFRAQDLYLKNKEKIGDPATRMHIEKNIQQQYNSVGTRMDAHSIENGTPFVNFPGVQNTYRGAISSIESGSKEGRYDLVGPETGKGRAYGRYQVMDFNIGPWTKEVLGKEMTPQEFLNDKEAQDAVFDAKFGQLVKKYGNPQDAASAWFSGRPLAQATAAGAHDVNIGVGEYVRRFNAALGKDYMQPLTPDSGEEWRKTAVERARAVAQLRAPDNPAYEDMLVTRVNAAYNNVRVGAQRVERENYYEIKGALLEQDRDGRPTVTSMDQILDNPDLNQRYNALNKAGQNAVQAQIQKNAKADVPLTQERWAKFQELQGLATTDQKKFLDTVESESLDLPRQMQGQLFNKARQLQKNAQENFGLTQAISQVTPALNDAGIRRSASDPTVAARYNQVVGAFQTERDQWIKDHGGKLPSFKENNEILSTVLRTQVESSWFPWQSERRQFEIPAGEIEKLDKDLRDSGIEPTAANRYKLYQHRFRLQNAAK